MSKKKKAAKKEDAPARTPIIISAVEAAGLEPAIPKKDHRRVLMGAQVRRTPGGAQVNATDGKVLGSWTFPTIELPEEWPDFLRFPKEPPMPGLEPVDEAIIPRESLIQAAKHAKSIAKAKAGHPTTGWEAPELPDSPWELCEVWACIGYESTPPRGILRFVDGSSIAFEPIIGKYPEFEEVIPKTNPGHDKPVALDMGNVARVAQIGGALSPLIHHRIGSGPRMILLPPKSPTAPYEWRAYDAKRDAMLRVLLMPIKVEEIYEEAQLAKPDPAPDAEPED